MATPPERCGQSFSSIFGNVIFTTRKHVDKALGTAAKSSFYFKNIFLYIITTLLLCDRLSTPKRIPPTLGGVVFGF